MSLVFFVGISLALLAAGAAANASSSSSLASLGAAADASTSSSHQTVILVSCDGFRWGYLWKMPTPNIDRIRSRGVEARHGLIPVYPTLTYPNHYSIATGFYPAWHGIVNNAFRQGIDRFNMSSIESKWWLGEPIWSTVVKAGLQAVSYFWPGAEATNGPWNCPKAFCPAYNQSVPFGDRVDSVLADLRLPGRQRPSLVALYFDEPDTQGHIYGPDSPQVDEAIAKVDAAIGRLLDGVENIREISNKVSFILVGDHGMVSECESKYIYLEDLSPWIKIEDSWVETTGTVLALTPEAKENTSLIVDKMREALGSGKVANGNHLVVRLKEDLPKRLLYSSSERIQPIIGISDEGYSVALKRPAAFPCGGGHGYDNELMSMRSIFIASGPRFRRGKLVDSFVNVNIYSMITDILGIPAAPNNASAAVVRKVLSPLKSLSDA